MIHFIAMSSNITQELEGKISELIKEEKWRDAYQLCNRILSVDPENSKVIHWRSLIEEEVEKHNRALIASEIYELQKLKKQGQYQEYFEKISRYQPYIPHFPDLTKTILEAKSLYEKYLQDSQKNFLKQRFAEIDQTFLINRQEALKQVQEILTANINNPDVLTYYQKFRSTYIKEELKAKNAFIESEKFEEILLFLFQLYQLDNKNPQVNKLLKKVNKKYERFKVEQRKDFIFKLTEEVDTLMLKRKYFEALKIADKILEIDPTHQLALKLKKKAEFNLIKATDKKIADQIFSNHSKFRQEMKFDRQGYIKI